VDAAALDDLLPARKGHFLLASGRHGDLRLERDLLFRHPRRVAALAAHLTGRLAPHHPDVVCGPLVGGTLVAQLVAGALDVDLCWTQPTEAAVAGEGLAGPGHVVPEAQRSGLLGATVAVVDDAVDTGSAVRASAAALEACGAEVVAVGALLVLGDAGPGWAASRNLPFERVAARPAASWAPAACPRCAAGEPLERGNPGA
jgi:orotate phosphoribosyltransferase